MSKKKIKYDPFGDTIKEAKKETKTENNYIRQTYIIRREYVNKLKSLAYWLRTSQKEILNEVLKEYFKGKKIKPI